jgi:hypothetical protein
MGCPRLVHDVRRVFYKRDKIRMVIYTCPEYPNMTLSVGHRHNQKPAVVCLRGSQLFDDARLELALKCLLYGITLHRAPVL